METDLVMVELEDVEIVERKRLMSSLSNMEGVLPENNERYRMY
jgi:hypothetical protein